VNISHYIQELLFTKQKVVLPYIGSFEMVSKPAHIDGATGTITPPSKTIKFCHNEGTDYSTLVNHVARKNGISPTKALKQICAFSEEINNHLHNGEEFEIDGVGILRVIGSGTVIFLPFSSYSNLGESFGLPTINITPKAKLEKIEVISEADLEGRPTPESPSVVQKEEEEHFELINDLVEESSTSTNEPQPKKISEQEQKIEKVGNSETYNTSAITEERLVVSEKKKQKLEVTPPIVEEKIKEKPAVEIPAERTPVEPTKEAQQPISLKKESFKNKESNLEGEIDKEATARKSKHSWIWPSLVIICILAIGLVALYHYNPNIFAFVLPSNNEMVVEPAVPSDVDSSYYKTLTSAATDTASVDSTRADSARANLQKIDSTSKKTTPEKKAVKTPSYSAKRPMSKEEMETLINEKLKLGNSAAAKTNDTQQRAVVNKQIQDVKPSKHTKGGFQVIAASVASMDEAKKIAETLKDKGYAPQIMDGGKGKIRISIGSYPTSRQAVNAANSARKKIGVNAWILNP
jgi:hypothetical protein